MPHRDICLVFEQTITKELRILTISAANGKLYAQSDVNDSKGFLFIEKEGKLRLGIFPGLDPKFGRTNLMEESRGALDHSVFTGNFSLTGDDPRDHMDELIMRLEELTSHKSSEVRGVSGSMQFIQDRTHYTNTSKSDVTQETWNAVLALRVYCGKTGTRPYTFTPGAAGGHEAMSAILKGRTLSKEHAEKISDSGFADFLIGKALSVENGGRFLENFPMVFEGAAAAMVIRTIIESQMGFDKPSTHLETGPLSVTLKSEAEFDGVTCCGTYRYDDEGVLFSEGLHDIYSRTGAKEHKTQPTGNFRISPTEDNGRLVLPHVLCEPGAGFDLPRKHVLVKGIGAGGGGEQITLGPAEAYVDGKAVSGFHLTTNARELLRNITGIGDKSTIGCVKCFRGNNVFGCDISPSILFKPFSLTAGYIR